MDSRRLPALVVPLLLVGLALAVDLAILATAPEGVFFLGDGGLKYLATRQIAAGNPSTALQIDAVPWVTALWQQGLYPFDFPFVVAEAGRHHLVFPPWFHWLSAPFLAVFGFIGLFAIPLGAMACTALEVARFLRRRGLGPLPVAIGVATLTAATPFFLYGALFWEHTLACALSTTAVTRILGSLRSTWTRAILPGVLFGLAGWLRPECLVLGGLFGAGLLWVCPPAEYRARAAGFGAGFGVAFLVLLAANLAMSGHLLGFHAAQVTDAGPGTRLRMIWQVLVTMLPTHALYAPIAVLAPLAALLPWPDARDIPSPDRRLLAVLCLLGPIVIAAIVPNDGGKQWGARYLLCCLPLAGILAGLLTADAALLAPRRRILPGVVAAGAMVAGIALNLGTGPGHLARDYRDRVAPTLAHLRASSDATVVVTHQWIAQDLASLFEDKAIVRTSSVRQLGPVAQALRGQGASSFRIVMHRALQPRARWSADLGEAGSVACERTFAADSRDPTALVVFRCALSGP